MNILSVSSNHIYFSRPQICSPPLSYSTFFCPLSSLPVDEYGSDAYGACYVAREARFAVLTLTRRSPNTMILLSCILLSIQFLTLFSLCFISELSIYIFIQLVPFLLIQCWAPELLVYWVYFYLFDRKRERRKERGKERKGENLLSTGSCSKFLQQPETGSLELNPGFPCVLQRPQSVSHWPMPPKVCSISSWIRNRTRMFTLRLWYGMWMSKVVINMLWHFASLVIRSLIRIYSIELTNSKCLCFYSDYLFYKYSYCDHRIAYAFTVKLKNKSSEKKTESMTDSGISLYWEMIIRC